MAIWNVLEKGSRWTYLEPDLTDQGIVGVWPASELSGSIPLTGGRLVLTEQALIFCPLDISQAKKMVDLVFSTAQIPGGDLVSKLSGLSRDSALVIPLANIGSVQQASGRKLSRPPTARVTTKVGSTYGFGVLAGTYYPNISKKNDAAIGDFLAKVQPLIGK